MPQEQPTIAPATKKKEGAWPDEACQRAFVEGAAWWQFHTRGVTMWSTEREEAEAEALRRYGDPLATDKTP